MMRFTTHLTMHRSGSRTSKTLRTRGWLEAAAVALAFLVFGVAWAAAFTGSLPAAARTAYLPEVADDGIDTRSASLGSQGADSPDASGLPPARIWLVDGYNVLHAGMLHREDRSQFWSRAHRERLRARVECFGESADEIWIVFDGDREAEHESRATGGASVRTVFAASADSWLVSRVRRAVEPGRLAVVTADRQVAGRARHRGAYVVSPRSFLERCPAS